MRRNIQSVPQESVRHTLKVNDDFDILFMLRKLQEGHETNGLKETWRRYSKLQWIEFGRNGGLKWNWSGQNSTQTVELSSVIKWLKPFWNYSRTLFLFFERKKGGPSRTKVTLKPWEDERIPFKIIWKLRSIDTKQSWTQ